jgi:hypothetical protein
MILKAYFVFTLVSVLIFCNVISGELGDYDGNEEVITDLKLIPKGIDSHLASIANMHKELRLV